MFKWPNGARAAVSLSFDDARPSQVDLGVPILNAHGVRATFYVSPPNIAQRRPQWQDALAAGHEIGNHTLSHPCTGNFPWSRANALEDYTLERMEQELIAANQFIDQTLGVTPRTFAYPCGQKFVGRGEAAQSYVPLVAKHFLAGRGFKDESVHDPLAGDLAQVMGIDGDDQSFDRLTVWIDQAVQAGGWLVFAMHDVGDFPRQAIHPDVLEAVCRYCTRPANGIWMDTVATVAAYIVRGQT
ncbi:MAG: polysaccharide deacetylase family protein [Anaerolineae bacterium]|nr:polysaccharide deacetylase family protein [Thermoflexales bacterium]MDW8408368.1 polysaccharide deacetylase family protein [Anaerolineae bacterium]